MQVSSYTPAESWGELLKLPTLLNLSAHDSVDALPSSPTSSRAGSPRTRRKNADGEESARAASIGRPKPSPDSAAGPLGPGEYSFSERLVRKTVLSSKFPRGDRFSPLAKDLEPSAWQPRRGVADVPLQRRNLPLRQPGLKHGRAYSCSAELMPTATIGYIPPGAERVAVQAGAGGNARGPPLQARPRRVMSQSFSGFPAQPARGISRPLRTPLAPSPSSAKLSLFVG